MAILILDSTTKSIKAVMSGAAATTNPDFTAAWADNNGTTFVEGASDGALSGTSSATLVAAPASSTRRVIKSITIENKDTAPVTVTISYDNNGTLRVIAKVTLNVGDTWTTDGTFDTNGSLKQTLGTVNLASGVTGTLATSNGGTGSSTGSLANCTVDGTNPVGYRNIPRSGSAKTTSYSLVTGDVGEYIEVGSGGSVTIPDATFATGDVVSVFNNTSGNITITCSITTAYIAGTDSDKATMTLATRGVATILFISGTVCVVNGNVS
jgi:hypothetical protein